MIGDLRFAIWLKCIALVLLLSTLNFQLSTCLAQGSLTPPGAPAPTMKSLDQIEPRTPVDAVHTPGGGNNLFIISQSGSYYLTTNLTAGNVQNAISIATNGVTLDLNGFTLFSTATNPIATGVLINSGLRDISIFNGHVKSSVTNNGASFSGTGYGYGIYYLGTAPVNTLVSQVTVSGVNFHGINLGGGSSTAVKSCTVNVSGNTGIFAGTVSDCTALNCAGTAITGYEVQNCYGVGVSNGDGIDAQNAQNCYGSSSGNGYGLNVSWTAQNCYGTSGSHHGIVAYCAQNCYGASGSGYGLNVSVAENCYATSTSGSVALNGVYSVLNCVGLNSGIGDGLDAGFALNCYGVSASGIGLFAATAENSGGSSTGNSVGLVANVASVCWGSSVATAIQANIGIGCYANSGTNNITHKYNMP